MPVQYIKRFTTDIIQVYAFYMNNKILIITLQKVQKHSLLLASASFSLATRL